MPLFDPEEEVLKSRRNLPHWKQDSKTYFITFRLADSLPISKRMQLKDDREAWKTRFGNSVSAVLNAGERAEYFRLFHQRVEQWLDAEEGQYLLKRGEVAEVVEKALHHFDGTRYLLGRFVVAANHVHVLVTPTAGEDISRILHSWKSFTAKEINRILNRAGIVWLDENFDHLVRSVPQLEKFEDDIQSHDGGLIGGRSFTDESPADSSHRQDACATSKSRPVVPASSQNDV